QVLAVAARRPVPHRARLDRGPAVAASPPRDERPDVRHRRPGPPRRRLGRAALPQPRRRPRGGGHLRGAGGPAAPRPGRRLAARPAHDHGGRRGAAHPEPGDLPVSSEELRFEGEDTDARAAARAAAESRELLAHQTGEAIVIGNEVAEVRVCRVETRNGARLFVESPKSGQWVALCPLEVEALTWQNPATFSAMIGNPYSPLVPEDDE